MRLATMARWLILLACSAAWTIAAAQSAPTDRRPPAVGRQAWFLDLLRTLADSEGPDDPDKVGAILGVRFDKRVVTTSPSHEERFAKSFERDEYIPASATWFAAGPTGHASVGNWRPDGGNGVVSGVDPVARGDLVNFKYFKSQRFGLLEKNALFSFEVVDNDSQTSILFYGIDKLTCLTMKDVQSRFPGLTHMEGTDASAERYLYYAKPREDAGAVLTFPAPRGQCVTEAAIEDFSAFGKRALRARFKFIACQQAVAKAYCAHDPARSLQEFRGYALFNATLRQRCEGLNAYVQREPRNNADPPGKLNDAIEPMGCPYPPNGH